MQVAIVGGGIGGLTLALSLHAAGIGCRVYEAARLAPACAVVLANPSGGPDALLGEVHRRTGDRPFAKIEDVISEAEMRALAENYQRIAGCERETLARRASLA